MIESFVLFALFQVIILGSIQDVNGANDKTVENNPLLPSDCGKQLTDKIVGGDDTALGEFPWVAALLYESKKKGRKNVQMCGGSLINKRYILTAAHCLRGLPGDWKFTGIRLGDYDLVTDPDCKTVKGVKTCADKALPLDVEKDIVHSKYKTTAREYDIALLRLKKDVTYTKYIKPVCLPRNGTIPKDLIVTGWGYTEHNVPSRYKLKVSVPYLDKTKCKSIYRQRGVTLGFGQICAGGEANKDSCGGDSGGPLMAEVPYSDGTDRWTVFGVVSFGPRKCGTWGVPGVYSDVHDFITWILNNLEA